MALATGQVSPLLVEGIRKLVGDRFRRYPLEFKEYLNMNTSKKNYEFDREVAGIGSLAIKGENQAIQIFDPRVGREKRYTHVAFAGGIRVSWEAEDDELYGFIRHAMSSLGDAANETLNIEGAGLFNRCDDADTNKFAGFDTLGLLSTAHTNLDGSDTLEYKSNKVAADISESVIQSALIQFRTVKDAAGNRVFMGKAGKIVLTTGNMFLIREILETEGKPFTADNTKNVIKGALTPVVLTYASDVGDDRWLILAENHDLNFFMRTPPVMDSYDDKGTKSMVNTVALRFTLGFGDWRGAIGSAGV